MSYFIYTAANCSHYQTEWEAVVQQVQNWPPEQRAQLSQLTYHLEAKALYVFTVVRRLIYSANALAHARNGNWKIVFIETSTLLFPMLELVGAARRGNSGHDLGAGIEWLLDPEAPPSTTQNKDTLIADTRRLDSLSQFMNRTQGPQVSDLFFLRNYYLHGLRNLRQPGISLADILNYELPQAIAKQAEYSMKIYWQRLCQDNGSQGWILRLSEADIYPFPIQGSDLFEAGIIDPNIVEYLGTQP